PSSRSTRCAAVSLSSMILSDPRCTASMVSPMRSMTTSGAAWNRRAMEGCTSIKRSLLGLVAAPRGRRYVHQRIRDRVYRASADVTPPWKRRSGHGYGVVEVHVLDEVEELHALGHGTLEGLAAGDEAHAAAALVEHGGEHRLGVVARAARRAARVDEASATHVAVGDLPADQLDGVVARHEVVVHALVRAP